MTTLKFGMTWESAEFSFLSASAEGAYPAPYRSTGRTPVRDPINRIGMGKGMDSHFRGNDKEVRDDGVQRYLELNPPRSTSP